MAKTVSIIPAKPMQELKNRAIESKLRVCAYCRVSTDNEEQLSSYEAQVRHYTEHIHNNPSWEFSGIYADEGISGTNTKNRAEFNRMIEDCMNGRVDLIITKSISRFARNTLDCLKYIRLLKEKNIAVFFEKENVNTLDSKGEFLITLLGSLAQEESRSLSTNTRWGIVHRFQQGEIKINHNRFLGYTKNENGDLVIEPEGAKVVKRIYREYLEGKSIGIIARGLEKDGILTSAGGKKWHGSTVNKILRNEKYMGDALLQKTYTVDFLTKKRIKNNGVVPQYYVENSHEPIISKGLFMRVQEEMARRANITGNAETGKGTYSSRYALSGITFCNECANIYRRCHWTRGQEKKIVWRCVSRLTDGHQTCKEAPTIEEKVLQQAVLNAINSMIGDRENFIGVLLNNIGTVLEKEPVKDTGDIDAQLAELQKQLMGYVEMNARLGAEANDFDREYEKISSNIRKLQARKQEYGEMEAQRDSKRNRIKEMAEFLNAQTCLLRSYDEVTTRKLVERVTVISDKELLIRFKSGLEVRQEI